MGINLYYMFHVEHSRDGRPKYLRDTETRHYRLRHHQTAKRPNIGGLRPHDAHYSEAKMIVLVMGIRV